MSVATQKVGNKQYHFFFRLITHFFGIVFCFPEISRITLTLRKTAIISSLLILM